MATEPSRSWGARPCRVVLIGMMGSGKTTVGQLLARLTGWPYLDNDDLLLTTFGQTARELLESGGEDGLRRCEAAALLAGLQLSKSCIVAAPAGTILDPTVRAAIEGRWTVVWLTASPQVLARRAQGAPHRPWLEHDAVTWMSSTLAERKPLYQQAADLTVDAERRTPEAIAAQIAAWLEERCS